MKIVNKNIRIHQASTSDMFGKIQAMPEGKSSPFCPRNPYGVAKLDAHWMAVNYRESYDIFSTSGILFNQMRPLRAGEFLTSNITDSAAKSRLSRPDCLQLCNIDAKRDLGYVEEYVEGMWRMLQRHTPDPFVLATNRIETVRNFVVMAFKAAQIDIEFAREDQQEFARDVATGKTVMRIDRQFYRPAEVEC